MEHVKIARSWWAAVLVLAVAAVAVALVFWISSPATAQMGQPSLPAVVVQWQPQSILETKFAARVAEDNVVVLGVLRDLAAGKDLTADEMASRLAKTYLAKPRLWTAQGLAEGWEGVLKGLKAVIARGSQVCLQSASALIDYRPYAEAATPKEDIDAVATVRVAFSASPGDNILEGQLLHSRLCPILP